ncbi:glycosyl hydrolase 115 family protein [Kribbella sp. NPDC050241]|uniref:glycosyl hydrolase 115 family protein n=1 Tax=Kribbella sp. NPDC050241 TaxID=3364115 RepID=UPI003795E02C
MTSSYVAESRDGGTLVAARDQATTVALAGAEDRAVRRAAQDLCRDLETVCGAHATISAQAAGARLVIGTIGVSPAIDEAIARGDLDVSALTAPGDGLRWEGFVIQAGPDAVYLAGADRRGTIFGIYDLCEAIGVSPWHWWGDVPVRRREHVTIVRGTRADWPSVRYRGIFLNDEEELDAWARSHTADRTIGPETYRRVFELLLRLKGNYLWPAMHVNAFNQDPANGRLAHAMGIVIGGSHCDMLLRSNEHEFDPWVAGQGEPVVYDYSLPGRNRGKLLEYWRGSIEQNRGFEVTWTVGMRGIHDYGFSTAAIDADGALSESEKHTARVRLLEQVIADQRALLAHELSDRADEVPQIFIPYKEVLPLYDAGLRVPDDVTIVWADDNFGYIRRFPSGEERERSGGHGLYYHSSYWSQPPRSYLATSSTPLALMRHELTKAWDHGIRRLWVDNVGGLKPLEIETEFFLRSAWEAGKESSTADVVGFVEQWAAKTFSGGHGPHIAHLYAEYYQLANQRKIEHLSANTFTQSGYGDEAGRRLDALHRLYVRTNEIHGALPADERDAFFQLIGIKIHLAYLTSAQFRYADRSTLAFDQGKVSAADHYLTLSRSFDSHKRAAVHYYNHTMSGGKWAHIFTPDEFPPPVMALYPAAKPALSIGAPGLGVLPWGDDVATEDPRLDFWPYGATTKWLEVFTTGAGGLKYQVAADDWIEVSALSGVIDTEARLSVSVPDAQARRGQSGTIVVRNLDDDTEVAVTVSVPSVPAPDPGFIGSVEADGYLSIDPSLPERRLDGASSSWATVPHLGRYDNSAAVARGDRDAVLEYDVHLVTAGAHLLELHRLPTLDATGRIRVAVSVDDAAPVVIESPTTDEYRGAWTTAVLDNVELLQARLPYLDAGRHTLRIQAVDPGVAVSKLVIYTGTRRSSNLGPQFSQHTARPTRSIPEPAPDLVDEQELARVARDIYRTDPDAVPPPPVVYAGHGFWDTDTTFKPNQAVAQETLAAPHSWTRDDGTKNVLEDLGAGVVVEEGGVLALEAEYALVNQASAWTTPSLDAEPVTWSHTQAETGGGSGLAVHIAERGLRWDDPVRAPGLHYSVEVTKQGSYHVWLLAKYDDRDDDSCWLAVDGTPLSLDAQYSGGNLYSFGTQQIWLWTLLSEVELRPGRHVLSILARKSGLRIDRLYLTTGDEVPPADADWSASSRH